ncbi:MAG: hypothetical protein RBS53_03195 [Bacteroidales bacterium]|jgi:hypothetical protein|nr:hypothetical protein [Bacteroidales bacterium]NLM92428.1 hypothetical protein [Bacteroidales bacterium]
MNHEHLSLLSFGFLVILALSGNPSLASQEGAGENPARAADELLLEETMQALYSFDFAKADARSAEMLIRFPDHYLAHFTRVQYLWWMIITQPHDKRLEEEFYQRLERSLSALKPLAGKEAAPRQNFYFINLYAMQARLFLTKKEYLRTIFSLKNCIDQIEATLGKEQAYLPFFLSSGMYNYMLEYARQKYSFLALYTLLYPPGDMKLGLEQLHIAARSDHFIWRTEARYLLMKIYQDLEQQPEKALPLVRALLEEHPSNLIFRWHYVKILEMMGKKEKAGEERLVLLRATYQATGLNESQHHHLRQVFGE